MDTKYPIFDSLSEEDRQNALWVQSSMHIEGWEVPIEEVAASVQHCRDSGNIEAFNRVTDEARASGRSMLDAVREYVAKHHRRSSTS